MENKAALGPAKVSAKGSDPKRKQALKSQKGALSARCFCIKKLKNLYTSNNHVYGSGENRPESMMEQNQHSIHCEKHNPITISVHGYGPLHRTGSMPVTTSIMMPSTYVRPALSEGSSTEMGATTKANRPKLPLRRRLETKPFEVVRDDNEGTGSDESNEVSSVHVVKRDFDLNLPPPEYEEWSWI